MDITDTLVIYNYVKPQDKFYENNYVEIIILIDCVSATHWKIVMSSQIKRDISYAKRKH